jgi:hypothetical protein
MVTAVAKSEPPRRPLRVWPGVIIVSLQWFLWLALPFLLPGMTTGYISALGGLMGGLLIVIWWAFLSRASRLDRWGPILVLTGALIVTRRFLHPSVALGGMGLP